jgi:hypothetical protein
LIEAVAEHHFPFFSRTLTAMLDQRPDFAIWNPQRSTAMWEASASVAFVTTSLSSTPR